MRAAASLLYTDDGLQKNPRVIFSRHITLSAFELKLLKIPSKGLEITALWRVMIKQCTAHQRRSITGKQSSIQL